MEKGPKEPAKKRPRKWLRVLVACGIALLALAAFAPWIIANTGLRDRLLASLIGDERIAVRSQGASFGYLSPLSIRGLNLHIEEGPSQIEIRKIQADKSWLSMLFDRPQLGSFTFTQPLVDVTLADGTDAADEAPAAQVSKSAPPSTNSSPRLTAMIEDATVTVRRKGVNEPTIDVGQVNLTFHIDRDDYGSVLKVDPVKVFDHTQLTPELCDKGIHLVAPLLSKHIDAEGAFSFELKQFQVPVGASSADDGLNRVEIAGTLQLHRATVGIKDSIVSDVAQLIVEFIGAELPERISVVEETEVSFQVTEGRVYHEGFAMVLPHRDAFIEMTSAGSVGLDRTLDLELGIGLPTEVLGDSELAKVLSSRPVQLKVTGTFEEPIVEVAPDGAWLDRIEDLLANEEAVGEVADLIGRTVDFLGEARANRPPPEERLLPNLRDRMRERRDERIRRRQK